MEDRTSRYLLDRKEDIKALDVRPRLIDLKPTKDFILSVIGPRRAGKTYLIYHFIKTSGLNDEDYLFANFEEIEASLVDLISKHQEIYGRHPQFLFLDEIQSLKDWEKEVYKCFERKKFHILLTGSSSKFLSKEIATQLRGRSLSVKVFPFSFKEILLLNNLVKKFYSSEDVGKIKNLLLNHLKTGFFPDIALKKIDPSRFITEYTDLVIYRDIMERYGVRNRVALEYFIKNVIASNSAIFSVNKIFKTMKSHQIRVSKNTLYNFQKFLEDVNVTFFLKKYSRSVRRIELSLPKAYVVDNALYTFSTYRYDLGLLMESLVFQELLKQGYEPNKNIFYFGDGYEVDFVLVENGKIAKLIQVTYSSTRDEIDERELKALLKTSDELKCKDLLVLTWDYDDETKANGKKIVFKPLWKWLLQQS